MWLLEFLFLSLTFLIGWVLFGYLLYNWFVSLFRKKQAPAWPATWPRISVIVPCYNEENEILAKLENLRALDYPQNRLEVIFADGGSTDQTLRRLLPAVEGEKQFQVVRCPRTGKTNQLNHVLPHVKSEIVVNTDVDSRLAPDALKWIGAEFASSPETYVVGAYCHPANTLAVEKYYWDAQNKGRFLESDVETSSIVIAQCYAFRRELLAVFPEDVVADDVYIAFLANTLGYRTVYSRFAQAVETRSPETYDQFLAHKFRKSNAFLRESLRFLYRLPEMGSFRKMLFLTRITQQLLLPWAMLLWVLLAGALLTIYRVDLVVFGASILALLLMSTNLVFTSLSLPDGPRRYRFTTVVVGYLLTNVIMLLTGLSYPFFRQGSCFARLNRIAATEPIEAQAVS